MRSDKSQNAKRAHGDSGIIDAPIPSDGLNVGRTDLSEALQIVSHMMGRRVSGASLRFEDSWLIIGAGKAVARAKAQGVWPLTIIVGTSWVRRLAKSLPPGEPVFLHVENGRLFANKYSEPCECSFQEPLYPSLGRVDETRRILEAAAILKPFLVGREDIQSLVDRTRKRNPISWREGEATMAAAIAKAWALLAPLGVETADLRELVGNAVRTSWKMTKNK